MIILDVFADSGQKFASTARHDPYRNFNFLVEFVGKTRVYGAGFSYVSGLKARYDIKQQPEGGWNGAPHIIPDKIAYEPMTFERGMSEDFSLLTAFASHLDNNYATNKNVWTINVFKLDRNRQTVRKTSLINAVISGYEESDLNAMGAEVLLERVVVTFQDVIVDKR